MKKLLIISSILGAIAVIIGAMGAHALKPLLEEKQLSWIAKGVHYQFVHVIMIFIAAILYNKTKISLFRTAAWLFIVGIILFSGSLYLLATRELMGTTNWSWLGPLTPMGGLSFIIGWLMLAIAGIRLSDDN